MGSVWGGAGEASSDCGGHETSSPRLQAAKNHAGYVVVVAVKNRLVDSFPAEFGRKKSDAGVIGALGDVGIRKSADAATRSKTRELGPTYAPHCL